MPKKYLQHKEKNMNSNTWESPPHILVDKKIQGSILKQSITSGEKLALNALAAELFLYIYIYIYIYIYVYIYIYIYYTSQKHPKNKADTT